MITFEYDDNGVLHAYKDGKEIGVVETMGDEIKDKDNGKTNS